MISDVNICNMALRRLGVRRIASFDERSPSAELCRQSYDQIVDIVLRDHDWGFATKTQEPALLNGETIIGWTYLYKKPSDCLKPRRIYTASTYGLPKPEPFRELLSPVTNTRVIAANLEGATLEYTVRIVDPSIFDTAFVDTLAWRIAAELAHPLTSKAELGIKFMQIYQSVLAQAKFLDENAKQEEPQSSVCSYIDDR